MLSAASATLASGGAHAPRWMRSETPASLPSTSPSLSIGYSETPDEEMLLATRGAGAFSPFFSGSASSPTLGSVGGGGTSVSPLMHATLPTPTSTGATSVRSRGLRLTASPDVGATVAAAMRTGGLVAAPSASNDDYDGGLASIAHFTGGSSSSASRISEVVGASPEPRAPTPSMASESHNASPAKRFTATAAMSTTVVAAGNTGRRDSSAPAEEYETYVGGNIADALDQDDGSDGDEVVGITAEGDLIFRRRKVASLSACPTTHPAVVSEAHPVAKPRSPLLAPAPKPLRSTVPAAAVTMCGAVARSCTPVTIGAADASPFDAAATDTIAAVQTSGIDPKAAEAQRPTRCRESSLGKRFEHPSTWRAPAPTLTSPAGKVASTLFALKLRRRNRENDVGCYFAEAQLDEAEERYVAEANIMRVALLSDFRARSLPR